MRASKEFSEVKVLSPRFVEIYRVAARYTSGVRMETIGSGGSTVKDSPTVKIKIYGRERKKQIFDDRVGVVTQRVGGQMVSVNPLYWYPVHRIRKHFGGKSGEMRH